MSGTFVLNALNWLEMDPHGVFTGTMGAMMSLFVVNGNSFNWRRTILILFAGVVIGGYSIDWIESKVVEPGASRALALLLNVLVGFVASDMLSSIKSAAPTATKFIVEKGIDFGKRVFSNTNTDKNDDK